MDLPEMAIAQQSVVHKDLGGRFFNHLVSE
jgi:hypothetical protein